MEDVVKYAAAMVWLTEAPPETADGVCAWWLRQVEFVYWPPPVVERLAPDMPVPEAKAWPEPLAYGMGAYYQPSQQ